MEKAPHTLLPANCSDCLVAQDRQHTLSVRTILKCSRGQAKVYVPRACREVHRHEAGPTCAEKPECADIVLAD